MTDTRMTLRQAAAALGVSESAVRKRVERGTLRSDKGADGRRYVYLDVPEPGADTVTDEGADTSATGKRDALISQLRDENRYLRDENRRKDEIIMQQAVTMRQLSSPAEKSAEDAETIEEAPEPRPDAAAPQTATERRWWEFWR